MLSMLFDILSLSKSRHYVVHVVRHFVAFLKVDIMSLANCTSGVDELRLLNCQVVQVSIYELSF
jgi:hypothetical protein